MEDTLTIQASKLVVEYKDASSSLLQGQLKIGGKRAERILTELQELQIVSELDENNERKVILNNLFELSKKFSATQKTIDKFIKEKSENIELEASDFDINLDFIYNFNMDGVIPFSTTILGYYILSQPHWRERLQLNLTTRLMNESDEIDPMVYFENNEAYRACDYLLKIVDGTLGTKHEIESSFYAVGDYINAMRMSSNKDTNILNDYILRREKFEAD